MMVPESGGKNWNLTNRLACQMMTGGRLIAETFKGYGVTHVFFVEAILLKTASEFTEEAKKKFLIK